MNARLYLGVVRHKYMEQYNAASVHIFRSCQSLSYCYAAPADRFLTDYSKSMSYALLLSLLFGVQSRLSTPDPDRFNRDEGEVTRLLKEPTKIRLPVVNKERLKTISRSIQTISNPICGSMQRSNTWVGAFNRLAVK